MSLTGLLLISFLIVHLIGNLMLFKADNGASFNAYAHFMSTALIIRGAEVMLVAGFIIHLLTAWHLIRRNRNARGHNYAYLQPQASWVSRHMGLTGSFILVFLVVHLYQFWYRYHFQTGLPTTVDGYKDMYFLTQIIFQHWDTAVFYTVAMILLGLHLSHGVTSALQSLGLNHRRYTPWLEKLGLLMALIIPAGFAAMPLYFLLRS